MEEALADLYYSVDSPTSFTSALKLYKAAKKVLPKITLRNVKDWLKNQYTYSLHRPIKRKYKKSRYFVTGIDKLWQIDLADMSMISDVNENYNFLLTCIDVFSKYAWVVPVRRKSGKDVAAAFAEILQSGRKPEKLQSDMGAEFLNREFQKMLKQHDIKFFTCNNPDIKCSIVERFNRTIKSRIWKYFTKTRSYKYIDVLQKFVSGYNNDIHSSIKVTPTQASDPVNEQTVYHNLYHNIKLKGKANFKSGDVVRISKAKGLFEKGYLPNWSEEVFTIAKAVDSNPPKYFLKDLMNESVKGGFYEQELQRTDKPESYWVEKVIKTRKRGGNKEYFVKWVGYPNKFNSWISERDGFLPTLTQ